MATPAYEKDVVAGISVTLVRATFEGMPKAAIGRLFVQRFAPADYDVLRVNRVRKALAGKMPKLGWWKRKEARTILVLENRDMAISNQGVIFDAVREAQDRRSDAPDEIWLVDVVVTPWTAWRLLVDGIDFPDNDSDTRWHDFDSSTLNNI